MFKLLLLNDIKKDMAVVEKELYKHAEAELELLDKSSKHLLKAGGKRIRPAVALMAAKFYNYDFEKILPLAVALELIHMASLVHDDVVDASDTRRGMPTVRAQWGNRISLHTGDYLFAKSLLLISKYEDKRIAQVLADVSIKMCQGEVQQIITSFKVDQNLRDYFYRIKRKTALLISASCELGGVVAGGPIEGVRALKLFGYNIGMAFQIIDDILDMTAKEEELGKPLGSDLRQGIITLPALYALKYSPKKDVLADILSKRSKMQSEVLKAIDIITESGGIEYSFKMSDKYLAKAKEQLQRLPNVRVKKTMAMMAEFIGKRKY